MPVTFRRTASDVSACPASLNGQTNKKGRDFDAARTFAKMSEANRDAARMSQIAVAVLPPVPREPFGKA